MPLVLKFSKRKKFKYMQRNGGIFTSSRGVRVVMQREVEGRTVLPIIDGQVQEEKDLNSPSKLTAKLTTN